MIRAARPEDAGRLARWCLVHTSAIVPAGSARDRSGALAECAADGCVLTASARGRLLGLVALHLPTAEIRELNFADTHAEHTSLPRLIERVEQLAVRFAIDTLTLSTPSACAERFVSLGYRRGTGGHAEATSLHRRLIRRQTAFSRRVRAIGEELGIPADYPRTRRLPMQAEAQQLESIGTDVFGREQRLAPRAARAWRELATSAAADGIGLQAVSAFRAVDYQRMLLERKLARGQAMAEILEVSAAPGYSEHHSGNAIDLTSPGAEPLETSFEETPAFRWLGENAARHGFHLSFPRDNRHGLSYEPWHWCYRG